MIACQRVDDRLDERRLDECRNENPAAGCWTWGPQRRGWTMARGRAQPNKKVGTKGGSEDPSAAGGNAVQRRI